MNIITYSSMSMFMTCRQKYDHRYNSGIVPTKKPASLLLGSAVHAGLEKWFKLHDKAIALDATFINGIELAERIKARELVSAYIDHYQNEDFTVYRVEHVFLSDIVNPVTKRKSRLSKFSGKVDGLIEKDGKFYIMEHKTVSCADDTYFMCKEFDSQIALYAVAIEQEFNRPVAGALYDVIIKPATKFSVGETDEEFEARKAESKAPNRLKKKEADTEESFSERVRNSIDESNFIRMWIEFNEADLIHKRQMLWNVAKDIQTGYIYENTSQCQCYGACEYAKLCQCGGVLDRCKDSYTICKPHEELGE